MVAKSPPSPFLTNSRDGEVMTEQVLSQALTHLAAILALPLPSDDDRSPEATLLLFLPTKGSASSHR